MFTTFDVEDEALLDALRDTRGVSLSSEELAARARLLRGDFVTESERIILEALAVRLHGAA